MSVRGIEAGVKPHRVVSAAQSCVRVIEVILSSAFPPRRGTSAESSRFIAESYAAPDTPPPGLSVHARMFYNNACGFAVACRVRPLPRARAAAERGVFESRVGTAVPRPSRQVVSAVHARRRPGAMPPRHRGMSQSPALPRLQTCGGTVEPDREERQPCRQAAAARWRAARVAGSHEMVTEFARSEKCRE